MISGKGAARWLLPSERGHFDSVLASWTPYRLSSRIFWSAVRAANRLGALAILPNVRALHSRYVKEADWRALGWEGKRDPQPVIYVGTPGPARKAVIHLVDPESGVCRMVVKVPLASGAKDAILRESNVLRALALQHFSCAPRLLHVDDARGITTQTFLAGKPGGRRFEASYWDLLASLMLPNERTSVLDHAVQWQEELLLSEIPKNDLALISSCLGELSDARPLPACWVHGDFAPWNIKHCSSGVVALLDWECSQWRGLPLYDAFHFLHMQDFLFGSRPTLHRGDVEGFARTIGLDSQQVRRLEIAYLSHAYAKGISQGEAGRKRSEFLLTTMAAALRERPRAIAVPARTSGKLQLLHSHSVNSPAIRAAMFSAITRQLEALEVPYCILSGYQDGFVDDSDLDIMVTPGDLRHIPKLLAQAASAVGAELVQSMAHETTACYFVMAKQEGRRVGYLDPDCCSDYRRDGRTWLIADKILAARRKYKNFYLPSVADEFIYYLIKKVLKQAVTPHHLERLRYLCLRNPAGCQRRMTRFWSPATAREIEQTLVEWDIVWLQQQLPLLLSELQKSVRVEPFAQRLIEARRDAGRALHRVLRPTGIAISIVGGREEKRVAMSDGLLRDLRPAFRRTRNVKLSGLQQAFATAASIRLSRIRSSLVICTAANDDSANGWRGVLHRVAAGFQHLLLRPDIVISLVTSRCGPIDHAATSGSTSPPQSAFNTIYVDSTLSEDQALCEASQGVLQWMAARLRTRMRRSAQPSDPVAPPETALEPALLQSAEGD